MAIRRVACQIQRTYRSRVQAAKQCSSPSISSASRAPRALRVPLAPSSHRTSCSPSASRLTKPARVCVSASAAKPPTKKSTTQSLQSLASSNASELSRRSLQHWWPSDERNLSKAAKDNTRELFRERSSTGFKRHSLCVFVLRGEHCNAAEFRRRSSAAAGCEGCCRGRDERWRRQFHGRRNPPRSRPNHGGTDDAALESAPTAARGK